MSAYEDAGAVSIERFSRRRLPIYVGFRSEILPFLAVLWVTLFVIYFILGHEYFLAIVPWATVTSLMLWPVGRRLGRVYLSYRTPLFVVGVLSMAYILFTGFALQSDWSYTTKLIIFLLLPFDLTIFGILPGLRPAIGRPIGMFFRPDLLFGDGRVLCCGSIAFVLGLRYFVGHPPPEGVAIPIPKWNWYAIFYAITVGFVPLIAIRGVLKLLLRVRRIRDDKWTGWLPLILRELLLVVTLLNIGFGFHNVFKGQMPFGESHTAFHEYTWVPVLTLVLGAAFLIGVRGAYKRRIGDPFIKETLGQTWVKSLLYVLGAFVLFWSLMSILDTETADITRAGYRPLGAVAALSVDAHGAAAAPAGAGGHTTPGSMETSGHRSPTIWPKNGFLLPGIKGVIVGPWNWVGAGLVIWGLIVLLPFRVLVQHYQRQAIVAQMAAFVVPQFTEAQRRRFIARMMDALLTLQPRQRHTMLRAMNEGLAVAPAENRAVVTKAMLERLVTLPAEQRDRMLEAQAAALGRLTAQDRVTRMTDMMSAVAELPGEQRRMVLVKMSSMLA
jgi:hypothetical protein